MGLDFIRFPNLPEDIAIDPNDAEQVYLYAKDDRSQLIIHAYSLEGVDENQVVSDRDPIVMYFDKGKQVQVRVTPFRSDAPAEIVALPFKEKIAHFKRKVIDFETNQVVEAVDYDLTLVTERKAINYGTINDFINALANPQPMDTDFIDYIKTTYLDMDEEGLQIFYDTMTSLANTRPANPRHAITSTGV